MKPRVVLVGLPGSGKTTIGKRVANALGLDLVDTDHLLEGQAGLPCGKLLSTVGEPEFRRLEALAVADALHTGGVVSLGGGAVVTESTRKALEGHTVVYLNVSIEEGVRRTSRNDNRPLLNVSNPREKYQQLFDERSDLYESVSDFMVHCDSKGPQRVVAAILQFLEDDAADRTAR